MKFRFVGLLYVLLMMSSRRSEATRDLSGGNDYVCIYEYRRDTVRNEWHCSKRAPENC